jgi:exosome complex component RRP4
MLTEGDLVSSDVHSFHHDGGIVLHARSLKYGKLSNGCLVKVPPSLVPRQQHHFVSLPCAVDVVLGNNGFVWLTATLPTDGSRSAVDLAVHEQAEVGVVAAVEAQKAAAAARVIQANARLSIARVRNSILALASASVTITPLTIMAAYTASESMQLAPKDLLEPATAQEVVEAARPSFA